MDKKRFLKEEFTPMLRALKPDQKGKWGVMNAQQMVEHLSEYVAIASGKKKERVVFDEEQSKRPYSFMMTDKPFRENTPNQLLPEVPPPVKNASMEAAIAELQGEINDFFAAYAAAPSLRVQSPFFGVLGFDEQVHLLHKHTTHHARQFGLMV